MKKHLGGLVVALLAILLTGSAAGAAGGTFDPATGIVTVTNTGGAGASYEFVSTVHVENGDIVSFEWRSTDVSCGGGVPRMFVQGGRYNTFDADPAGVGACGTDTNGDGWFTVTGTVTGVVNGDAGLVGLVNDNPADLGTIQFRNVTIDGVSLLPEPQPAPHPKDQCKDGGWQALGYRNQGACVSHFARMGNA